jgi:hypothetical protein
MARMVRIRMVRIRMVRTSPISRMALAGLGGLWLGLGACGGNNEIPTSEAPLLEIPDDISCEGARETPVDSEWRQEHVLCGITTKLEAIAKRIPCTPEDPQSCWKTCGPNNIGFKELTCRGGAYAEDSMCDFDPNGDFSCYRIPDPEDVHPDCPTSEVFAPRHNEECSLPPCTVCGGNTYEQTTGYRNSSEGLMKPGYCICVPAIMDGDVQVSPPKWKCATQGTAWPCPNGCGC